MAIKLDKAKLQSALDIFAKTELVRIDETIAKLSEAYTDGEEKPKISLTDVHGQATIVHDGDGDAGLETRVYIDGSPTQDEAVASNEFAIIFVTFTSSLEIRTYATVAGTYGNSAMQVSGFRRTV